MIALMYVINYQEIVMSKYLEGMSEYDKGFVDGNRAKKALQVVISVATQKFGM